MSMNDIYALSEEDIKRLYITPALDRKGWKSLIRMEVAITQGKVWMRGNMAMRDEKNILKADYILSSRTNGRPLAVLEAKNAKVDASHGMQQAKKYAERMDVPFAYSSNGLKFCEYDFLTGKERVLSMDDFPSPDELEKRYLNECNNGQSMGDDERKIYEMPNYSSQETHPPRYYQQVAIDRTVRAIARGQNRLLLVMATGTGKTLTAFQIVHRLLKTGLIHRVLYLADRNVLVDQSRDHDFKPLEKVTTKVQVSKMDRATANAYQVYFALYQQLIGDDDHEHFKELFSPDFFDLVIVDECHRGSAREDSRWRKILDYFSSATHLGMTATPKETQYQSNLSYFGEPIYTYSLNQGIEDGFLAPFKVYQMTTNIGDGWRPTVDQLVDSHGRPIEDRIYTNQDFDYNIILEDRTREVAEQITRYLKRTDRMAKTIVFCANIDHAERIRQQLTNLNSDMCQKNPHYVVRITGDESLAEQYLYDFNSINTKYPVIAVTSKLLSTGVDTKMVKFIVLDQNISSMTEFKQIIGRGTRLNTDAGKWSFTVMDFRNVTRLFADPKWDGPLEINPGFESGVPGDEEGEVIEDPPPGISGHSVFCPVCGMCPCQCPHPPPRPLKPVITRENCQVFVIQQTVSIYDPSGKLLRTESITDYTRKNAWDMFPTLEFFDEKWKQTERKQDIIQLFERVGIDLLKLRKDMNLEEVDLFDFIRHIAFDKKPLSRRERAKDIHKRDVFNKYGQQARQVLDILINKYMDEGILEMEDRAVLCTPSFQHLGSISAIMKIFGGKEAFNQAIRELEQVLYSVK